MSDTPTTPEPQPEAQPQPQPQPQPSTSTPPPAPEPAESAVAAAAAATTPKPRSALALWSMIAGIVAMVGAIIPGLSFVAWIPALAAIVLGIIALVKKTPRRGQALTGVILGPVAWLVAIIVSIGFIAGIGSRVDDVAADAPEIVDEEPAPSEAAPEPEPEPEVVEPAPDVVYSGSGDTILQIELPAGPDSIGIATMTHSGRANFAVWSLDANLEQTDLLVNEIGSYSGTVPFNQTTGEQITAFEITADGPWTVTLRDVLSVREAPQGASTTGQGDDVLVYRGDATVADISHTGSSNFAVWSFGDRSDLLVNEIGTYSGQVRWQAGAALIQVSADGAWTIALQ
ncbi:DUF4190 domain-containing protein [Microcella frigidaquae]|uniref:DUF4190 domain-containing protein n=1 Tax=Microcella frigidaquae TaxID=424758 RepID=A0A840XMA2_9MICO|nr:DUF4190 domain-containing protein [Microcella frigidaquae]MBB5617029.1 hypothetical protein [Microcella frigidaquae]NHN45234.1 DUF4190 domain-containing protein [Microcella frigidaquae]